MARKRAKPKKVEAPKSETDYIFLTGMPERMRPSFGIATFEGQRRYTRKISTSELGEMSEQVMDATFWRNENDQEGGEYKVSGGVLRGIRIAVSGPKRDAVNFAFDAAARCLGFTSVEVKRGPKKE